jgi:hypothetical protein
MLNSFTLIVRQSFNNIPLKWTGFVVDGDSLMRELDTLMSTIMAASVCFSFGVTNAPRGCNDE